MTSGYRIKEAHFSQTFSAATTGSFPCDLGSQGVINGEILECDTTFNRAGSFAYYLGRTGEAFFTSNSISGASPTVSRPRLFATVVAGSIAGASMVSYIAHDVLWMSVSGAASGTQAFAGTVRYR